MSIADLLWHADTLILYRLILTAVKPHLLTVHVFIVSFKEALTVLMLCAPVFIFTSGSSALLGRPRCG